MGIVVVVAHSRILGSIKYPTGFTFLSSRRFLSKRFLSSSIIDQKTVHYARSINILVLVAPSSMYIYIHFSLHKTKKETLEKSQRILIRSRTNDVVPLTRVSLTRWKGQEARETGIFAQHVTRVAGWLEREGNIRSDSLLRSLLISRPRTSNDAILREYLLDRFKCTPLEVSFSPPRYFRLISRAVFFPTPRFPREEA